MCAASFTCGDEPLIGLFKSPLLEPVLEFPALVSFSDVSHSQRRGEDAFSLQRWCKAEDGGVTLPHGHRQHGELVPQRQTPAHN